MNKTLTNKLYHLKIFKFYAIYEHKVVKMLTCDIGMQILIEMYCNIYILFYLIFILYIGEKSFSNITIFYGSKVRNIL